MNEIAELTKSLIQSKIVEALNSKDDYIEQLVNAALNGEVNEYGRKPDGYRDRKMPWLQYAAESAIKTVIHEELGKFFERKRPEIREIVEKNLSNEKIVGGYVTAITNSIDNYFTLNINIERGD